MLGREIPGRRCSLLILLAAAAQDTVKIGLILPHDRSVGRTGAQIDAAVKPTRRATRWKSRKKIEAILMTSPASPTSLSAWRRSCGQR
jgi:hypothetical protein